MRVRHVKRGSEYDVIGKAMLQISGDRPLQDMERMIVYRADNGTLWVRPEDEFDDGRFVPVSAIASEAHDIAAEMLDPPGDKQIAASIRALAQLIERLARGEK